jgi:hypothetical protein
MGEFRAEPGGLTPYMPRADVTGYDEKSEGLPCWKGGESLLNALFSIFLRVLMDSRRAGMHLFFEGMRKVIQI